MKVYVIISLEGGLLRTVEAFRDEKVAEAEYQRQMREGEPDWPDEEPCIYFEEAELMEDLSRCECGSDQFLVDTTDTIAVELGSEGRIREYGKRYEGDFHNLNCERCGRPAARQPNTLQDMYARRQREAKK